jgi:hypothetical protein
MYLIIEGRLLAGSSYSHHRNSRLVNNRLLVYTGTSTPLMAYSSTRPKAALDEKQLCAIGYLSRLTFVLEM